MDTVIDLDFIMAQLTLNSFLSHLAKRLTLALPLIFYVS